MTKFADELIASSRWLMWIRWSMYTFVGHSPVRYTYARMRRSQLINDV